MSSGADFPEHVDENRRIWDANARWWDDRIGDGNDFQTILIEPATERLLRIAGDDTILDIACGAGRFARRMASLGARVLAFDTSSEFITRARERTAADASIDYRVLDASKVDEVLALGVNRFSKAVCTMAIMDLPEIAPLFRALSRLLRPGGAFVFSVTHPCFHSPIMQRFAEVSENQSGQHVVTTGVKVSSYLSPSARKTEGIVGQPTTQFIFHRPLGALFQPGFAAGFVVDGIEEPRFPDPETVKARVGWRDMAEIPPILVVRMTLVTPAGDRSGGD